MNEQIGNSEIDFLWKLLANPADPNHSYAQSLQSLADRFPQSGVLRALLVPHGDDQHLKQAASYFNPAILYKIVNDPDSLPSISAGQVVYSEASGTVHTYTETVAGHYGETNYFHVPESNVITDEVYEEQQDIADIIPGMEQDNEAVAAKQENVSDMASTETIQEEPVTENDQDKAEYFHQDIDDEIYDEIVSIEDINLEQLALRNNETVEQAPEQEVKEEAVATDDVDQNNYFVFESSPNEDSSEQEQPAITAETNTAASPEGTTQNVSRYNDEKMPYTFMWWLDKTRKEHADIYQPYISNNKPVVAETKKVQVADELQQQYYENIFNINSIDELDKTTATQPVTAPHAERKEDKIIERFIQEEPQIKHPSMVKLDSENKAKKSSEDRDELVTETLAKIYTEQMLYHKALLTYKKLMLKFPEKSLYFAGQIEQLENKIN